MTSTAYKRRGDGGPDLRGNARDRRARKNYLLDTYRADVDALRPFLDLGPLIPVTRGTGLTACRCYRCGELLIYATLTVDRIKPGARGGRYVRNNIRPSCAMCANDTSHEVRGIR